VVSFAAPQLSAQVDTPTTPRPSINLTLEQRHVIKELMKDIKVEKAPADTQVTVGAEVPTKVSLQPMPQEIGQKVPQVKTHMFFVTPDKVVIVDPKDNKIAEVLE
jgi:hypothetical protein